MYTSFRVKNFRGFEDFELNDLARVNLIAGKNNVGKTALLEALYLHGRAYNPRETLSLNQARGLEFSIASDISLSFYRLDTTRNVGIEGTDRQTGLRSLTLRVADAEDELARLNVQIARNGNSDSLGLLNEDFQVLALDYKQELDKRRGTAYFVKSSARDISLVGALPPPIRITFIPAQGRSASDDLARRFSSIEIANQQETLINTLRILEPRLERISLLLVGEKPELRASIGNMLLPLGLLGEGLNRLFNFVTAIIENQGGVVLIDEIENGLHYSILIDVWKDIADAAREFNVQIFATTHSLEMIRAAHEAFKDDEPYDFRLHRLDRSYKTGEIYATTYNEQGMEAITNLNAEVRG